MKPDVPESHLSDNSENEGDDVEIFRPLIDAVDHRALASVALKTRLDRARFEITRGDQQQQEQHQPISCDIKTPPILGSSNLVYVIEFSDGVRWVARIPGNGVSTTFGDLDRTTMVRDLQTMRLIRSATSIPIPDIFHWETTKDTIGAPYALMSFVEGTSVIKRWFDKSWVTEEKRLKILRCLAKMMSELHTLKYDKIGALSFDQDGRFTHVGEIIRRGGYEDDADEDPEHPDGYWGQSHNRGPFNSTRSYLLDDWDDLEGRADWRVAELAIVRLAVDSIPDSLLKDDYFVLSPPDFDSQNVFVDDEGNVTGIIDWDSISTQPRVGGFARYPSWITRDWDPVMYRYNEPGCNPENFPEELSRYRQEYVNAFAKLDLPATDYSLDETKLSHIFEAVDIAVNSQLCRMGIVQKLLEHAFHSKIPFDFRTYCNDYLAGKGDQWLRLIEDAFRDMWHVEWE